MPDEAEFPILDGKSDVRSIPLEWAQEAYKEYAHLFSGQSFERIRQRGGFGAAEVIRLLVMRCQRLEKEKK